MRILLISPHFPNIFGGVSDYTYQLSRAFVENRTEIYVLTSRDERIILDVGKNVKVLSVIERWNFLGIFQVIREIRKVSPDWVLLQYVPYMYSHYGVPVYIALFSILVCIMRFKLITTFHEVAIRFDMRRPKYWIVFIIQRIVAFNLALNSHWIIVSVKFYQDMLKIFKKKIIIIPVGSNFVPIKVTDEEKINLRKKICSADEIIISTFGSNSPQRKNDVLLRAIRLYNINLFPKVKLVFLGKFSQNFMEKLIEELQIKESVYFTGYLKEENVYRHLCISDIFVIFDIGREGEGGISAKSGSLAAAYAAGLPIIGNRADLTDDFLKHRKNIYLLNSITEEEIVNAIKEIINDKELKEKLRTNALKTYQERLDWQVIAKKYIYAMSGM